MGTQSVFDKFFVWLIALIARWTFKVLSGVLIGFGIEEGQWELWIGAAVSFLIGWVLTLVQNSYLAKKQPEA